ncbi:uncharacterized protein [Temnothorax longispinosus]|uniref:uncharacterized protein n=1 Tax=Temnothorax longispinosus TaxID=300112 RepID=UPI003A9920F9
MEVVTNKIISFFDASAKSTNGVSLNQMLMVGPTIQAKLPLHLIRFRTYKYVITADIVKMYRQLAEDEQHRYPRAAAILKEHFYVDNLISGAKTIEDARAIRDELIALLSLGGFPIKQWASNNERVVNDLSTDELHADFVLNLDRSLKTLEDYDNIQLHGFCDASNAGYGACLYIRSRNKHGNVISRLLCAKSRVATLKTITIPRLELCGALLLARLYRETIGALEIAFDKKVFWCDAQVVLHWIATSPHLLKNYVANRVAEIQEISSSIEWRYVRTEDNPADAISRGQLPHAFLRNQSWPVGPSWLIKDEGEWPNESTRIIEIPELKENTCLLTTSIDIGILERQKFWLLDGRNQVRKVIRAYKRCFRFSADAIEYKMGNLPPVRIREAIPFANTGIDFCGPFYIKEKKHLGDSLFTFEELNTFTIEVEGILNSRPITSLSTDPNDLLVLTPAHYLIGKPLTTLPEGDLSSVPANWLSTWQHITKVRQDFWARWNLEYLNELQMRNKWTKDRPKLDIGTVVLIKDKNTPCTHWALGRITELHPGTDGITRAATVKTAVGQMKRAANCLCPLPIEQQLCDTPSQA